MCYTIFMINKQLNRGEKMTKYITIKLNTIQGFNKAERLKSNGWIIFSVGFDTIQLYKEN